MFCMELLFSINGTTIFLIDQLPHSSFKAQTYSHSVNHPAIPKRYQILLKPLSDAVVTQQQNLATLQYEINPRVIIIKQYLKDILFKYDIQRYIKRKAKMLRLLTVQLYKLEKTTQQHDKLFICCSARSHLFSSPNKDGKHPDLQRDAQNIQMHLRY